MSCPSRILPIFPVILLMLAGCSRDEAERKLERARKEAAARLAEAEQLLEEWKPALTKAAHDTKAEMNRVAPSDSNWEFLVEPPEEGKDKLGAFEEKLSRLDRVTVGSLTIGYEQRGECTIAGQRYERHFRARWASGDRVYCIACCSKGAVDVAAFLDVLQRVVPVSTEVLRHVRIEAGK